jgi:hypothetical protein
LALALLCENRRFSTTFSEICRRNYRFSLLSEICLEVRGVPQDVRGVWVVQAGKTYWARVFGKDPSDTSAGVIATAGHSFEFKHGGELVATGIPSGAQIHDAGEIEIERAALLHILGLMAGAANGIRHIEDGELAPYLRLT